MLVANPGVYTDSVEAVAFRHAAWQAISVCGSDMSGGAGLYEVLCYFECTRVQRLVDQHGARSDAVKNASDVAHAVWEKRVAAALPGGDEVLKAYKEWDGALPDPSLRKTITDKLHKVLLRHMCCTLQSAGYRHAIYMRAFPDPGFSGPRLFQTQALLATDRGGCLQCDLCVAGTFSASRLS